MSIVNIFSGSFCNAEEVAQSVAAELGCRLVRDEDLIGRVARDTGADAGALRRAMYGKPSIFNQFSHERERSVARLRLGLARLFEGEDMVFLGMASRMAPRAIRHILRVCLIGEAPWRAANAARELGLSEKEGLSRVHRDDEAAIRWVESLGGHDPWDAGEYDILLPMDSTPVEEAARLIVNNAKAEGLRPTPSSRQAESDFLLAARVEARMAEEGHDTSHLEVAADEGQVTISVNKKVLRMSKLAEELEALGKDVDGVAQIKVEPGPGYYQADVYRQADFRLPSKVLLVDDEREFVQTLSERLMLREIGSAVVFDGEEALRVVARDEPEVIVLDLKMPGIDGEEVLRRIKRDHPEVEVIILTGHGSERDKETCLELGAFAYLEKPVDIDRLSQVMQEAYDAIGRRRG